MKHPRVPTAKEISPSEGLQLDEKRALDHFLGKTVEQAAVMFQEERNLGYTDDLMWMGPRAFAYYLPAVMAYMKSAASRGNSDFVNHVLGTIESQLEDGVDAFRGARDVARTFLAHCLERDDESLGVEPDGPHRQLRKKLTRALSRVERVPD